MSSRTLYVGTYTSSSGSKGIYRVAFDDRTGGLGAPEMAVEAPNPSFLARHPRLPVLYAVHESTEGDVGAYAIEAGGGLRHLSTRQAGGAGPCHLCLGEDGRNLFVAAYGGGTVAQVPLDERGRLLDGGDVFKNQGSGPDKSRQTQPHMHWVGMNRQTLYACDLGTDDVLAFDLAGGRMSLLEGGRAKVPGGAGPRHATFHPHGRFLYVNNEMACTVTVFEQMPTGLLRAIQTVEGLDEVAPGTSGAEIGIHPSGKWLYVSNRGADSLSCFEVTGEGTLERARVVGLPVRTPRSFALDPSGEWLVAAGQGSGELKVLKVDAGTGALSPAEGSAEVHSPACVLFG